MAYLSIIWSNIRLKEFFVKKFISYITVFDKQISFGLLSLKLMALFVIIFVGLINKDLFIDSFIFIVIILFCCQLIRYCFIFISFKDKVFLTENLNFGK
jgi:hypothetical protein